MNRGQTDSGEILRGQIIAAFGRNYLVETPSGLVSCVPRGKKSIYACGDIVRLLSTGIAEGVLDSHDPRRTLLLRSAKHRQKLISANATQVAIIVAASPSFSDELIARIQIAAENSNLSSFIALNKSDLKEETALALERLRPFTLAGYPPILLSAKIDPSPVRKMLEGNITTLVGQSGMGKSTLINSLIPGSNVAIKEISKFLDSGKHTTTHARLYHINESSAIVDCPGLQEFGLAHLTWREIAYGFREFRPHLGQCRFPDCRHLSEPGCAVHAAAESGSIPKRRLHLYQRILEAERAA